MASSRVDPQVRTPVSLCTSLPPDPDLQAELDDPDLEQKAAENVIANLFTSATRDFVAAIMLQNQLLRTQIRQIQAVGAPGVASANEMSCW